MAVADGALPTIDHDNQGHVFMDVTPDTQGGMRRRFQEIIDSEDETNGNGSKIQRFQKSKKFTNQRDGFGGAGSYDEMSSQRINFAQAEQEIQEDLKLNSQIAGSKMIENDHENYEDQSSARDAANDDMSH